MPTIDISNLAPITPERITAAAFAARSAGALPIADFECGMGPGPDGADTVLFVFVTSDGQRWPFSVSPVGGVLVHQQIRDMIHARGGILAVLRQVMHDEPAFEGSER